MKPTISQSASDLQEYFNESLNFLEASCRSYDAGMREEAKRLAVTIRVLVHDTQKSTSLLQQLNIKTVPFLNTALPIFPNNLANYHGLISVAIGPTGAQYLPLLGEFPASKKISFDDWWGGTVLIDSKKKSIVSKGPRSYGGEQGRRCSRRSES